MAGGGRRKLGLVTVPWPLAKSWLRLLVSGIHDALIAATDRRDCRCNGSGDRKVYSVREVAAAVHF